MGAAPGSGPGSSMSARVELLGRDREAGDVARRLSERRLVTIVGPGGIGKTALAQHVLRKVGCSGAVDLTSISTDDAVAGAVASQLGHPSFDALLASPAPSSALVIDNCEHVLAGAASTIDRLLEADADWRILATSRSPLNLADESIVGLGPLASSSAVELFLTRARDAGVEIDRTDLDVVDVVHELCRRLDGVPLAIEIAAARTRAMTPAMILEHVRLGVDVLERPRFRGPDRHRSVRETIAWSYGLLGPAERTALDRLSVCAGPFDLPLAAVVIGDDHPAANALQLIDVLAEASLVNVDAASQSTPYRLLETIRAFALVQLERAGQRTSTEDRFIDHVVASVVDIMERGRAGWTADVLHELLLKFDNISAALTSSLERDSEPTRCLLLSSVLWGVVHNGHVDDVAQLSRSALQRWPDPEHPFWPDAMASLSTATLMLGDIDGAVALAETAAPHATASPFAPATLPRVFGLAAHAVGDHGRAAEIFADASVAARASGAGAMAMEADVFQAQALALVGRHDEALQLVRRSRREAEAGNWHVNSVFAAVVEGLILLALDSPSAWSCLAEALETSRSAHYPYGVTASLQSMAYAHLRNGRDIAAAATISELVDEMKASPSDWSRADPLGPVAALMYQQHTSGWEDIAATAEWRARTSPLPAAGLHLVDLPAARGRVLPARQANHIMLAVLATAGGSPSPDPSPTNDGSPVATRSVVSDASFALDGEMWTVTYAGLSVHLKSSKGMRDLAELLTRPGSDVSCLDLAGSAVEDRSTGEVIDGVARRQYEDRIRELQADIDEAESHGDGVRAERAQAEFDALVDHLTNSLGLAGRSRRHVDTTERARSAVTQRIRATIKRIEAAHPQLGAHLRSSVRTGIYCSYRPETPVRWTAPSHDVTTHLTTPR